MDRDSKVRDISWLPTIYVVQSDKYSQTELFCINMVTDTEYSGPC